MAKHTYQLQVELTNDQTQIVGEFSVSDGERGERGETGATGAVGRPVYYKTSGESLNDLGITNYIVAIANLYPTDPTPIVGDTVILSTNTNTYIGSIISIQSNGAVVKANASLKGEAGGALYFHKMFLMPNKEDWAQTADYIPDNVYCVINIITKDKDPYTKISQIPYDLFPIIVSGWLENDGVKDILCYANISPVGKSVSLIALEHIVANNINTDISVNDSVSPLL